MHPVMEVVDILDDTRMVECRDECDLFLNLTHPLVTFSVLSSLVWVLGFLLYLLIIFTAFLLPSLLSRIS